MHFLSGILVKTEGKCFFTVKGFAMLGIGKTGWIVKEKPHCGALDAIVRPIAVSPCTSDIHTVYEGALGERHNMILGHEAVGEVVTVGRLVKDFKPGDRVVVTAITPDWGSAEAQDGYAMHSGGMLAGWKFSNFKDGVFGEYFHVNEADANLAHLPESIEPQVAVMLCDMMPTGLHGAELCDIRFGNSVCVVGIGPVGLMAVAGAVLRGASRVFAVGSRPICAKAARLYGATDIINYRDGDIVEQILKLTDGSGVDRVILAGGGPETVEQAVRMTKPGGKIGNVNYFGSGGAVSISLAPWGNGMAHKQISGGLMPGGRLRAERLLSLVENGRIDPSHLVTHVFEGFDKIPDALELMKNKPSDLIKPVVLTNF